MSVKAKFTDWAADSPVVGIPVMLGVVGYSIIRSLGQGVKWQFDLATRPLSYFEPKPPKGGPELNDQMQVSMYQQELEWTRKIMGDGRADKLLQRLKDANLPEVGHKAQVWALAQSTGGLTHLPQHEQLVKYGLNDNYIARAAGGIRCAIDNKLRDFSIELPRDEWKEKPKSFIEGGFTAQDGLIHAGTGEIIKDRNFFINCYMKPSLSSEAFYHKADPGIPDKIAGIVLDWLVEDVKPAVPDIFGDMKVSEFTPEYKPQGFHQQTPLTGSSPS